MSEKSNRLDVLAVIRAPLEQYPPSVNQMALLAEASLRVGVVDCHHGDFIPRVFQGPGTVERFRPCGHTQLYKEELPNPAVRLCRHWIFQRAVFRACAQRKPKVVVAYDPYAMVGAGRVWGKPSAPKVVWHFHELCPRGGRAGRLGRQAVQFAFQYAVEVDLVTHADAGRAEMFKRQAGLKTDPTVVMNCPRRLAKAPTGQLAEKLAARGMADRPAVYFHGWIGPSRCIEATIQSMRWWPENAVFIIVGPVAESYRNALSALGAKVGVAGRVVFLGSVPYAEVLQLAAGASVGCSMVADQSDPNWTYSAGAINKRFEYMAVGLPQVANKGPGMKEIIERHECGLLVDPDQPREVGEAIGLLLRTPAMAKRMGENGRCGHLETLNYESQFLPVLEQIVSWCKGWR